MGAHSLMCPCHMSGLGAHANTLALNTKLYEILLTPEALYEALSLRAEAAVKEEEDHDI